MEHPTGDISHYDSQILLYADGLYHAAQRGVDHPLDQDTGPERAAFEMDQVLILPPNPGDTSIHSPEDITEGIARAQAAARSVCRIAILQDSIEKGGIFGAAARVEMGLTRLFERKRLQGALIKGGPVDKIRGKIR